MPRPRPPNPRPWTLRPRVLVAAAALCLVAVGGSDSGGGSACNIRAIYASAFRTEQHLAKYLAASVEPLIIKGFAPEPAWPCSSINACVQR